MSYIFNHQLRDCDDRLASEKEINNSSNKIKCVWLTPNFSGPRKFWNLALGAQCEILTSLFDQLWFGTTVFRHLRSISDKYLLSLKNFVFWKVHDLISSVKKWAKNTMKVYRIREFIITNEWFDYKYFMQTKEYVNSAQGNTISGLMVSNTHTGKMWPVTIANRACYLHILTISLKIKRKKWIETETQQRMFQVDRRYYLMEMWKAMSAATKTEFKK